MKSHLALMLFSLGLSHVKSANLTKFPAYFTFGAATASYQIEGGWNEGGKVENIWDHTLHLNTTHTLDGKDGDIACDSYHKIKEDVAMLNLLKVNGYRFSLSWSRLFPLGFPTKTNPEGERYYNELITQLIANDIEPWVTLYHWDLPQSLQDIGGWANPLLADIFQAYCDKVFQLFGDRVRIWYTFNEPANNCVKSYNDTDAPFLNDDAIGTYQCGHTMLRAHGKAYRLYQRKYKRTQKGKVGIVLDSSWYEPLNAKSQEDMDEVEQYMQMYLGWFAHPIFSKTGDYPQIMRNRLDRLSKQQEFPMSRLPNFTADEVQEIRGAFDFMGINHYTVKLITTQKDTKVQMVPSFLNDLNASFSFDSTWEPNGMPVFRVTPFGIRKLLKWITKEYGDNIEISITENGYAGYANESVDDKRRVNYLNEYLKEILQAINEGCNVTSYIYWSLMDNFEWSWGYTIRFGLFHVDFNNVNRTRTPKASAYVYQNIIATKMINESYYPSISSGGIISTCVQLLITCLFAIFLVYK